MDEFALIARYFAPLAAPEGLALTDDAATIPLVPGKDLVVTADAIVEGVHFLPDDPPDLVARKLLRVNLSDLAAKGARPAHYVLTVAFPKGTGEEAIAAFARGLGEDQARFGVKLLGGDTVATPGPATFSLTAFGWADGAMLRRGGARPGDLLFVSGTIGDAGLGLRALTGAAPGLSPALADFAAARYRLPEPRVSLGPALAGLASAALDVSDGLVADAGHMADVSGVNIRIEADRVPLSAAVREALGLGLMTWADILSAGDDYEILFAAPAGRRAEIAARAAGAGVAVSEIGRVAHGAGVAALDGAGMAMTLPEGGYRHF
ncbi:MAG: thiamine-phosphate kinase [Alphaproteobacteria bacterium]|nr:thiamine-phosphate kinase [Alphaproteobacteria bacterium]